MMRKNQPVLFRPLDTVEKVTDKALGIPTMLDVDRRLSALERGLVALTQRLDGGAPAASFASMEALLGVLEYIMPGLVWGKALKGTTTPTAVTSTTPTTITSFNLGPLVKGVEYLTLAIVANASNADPAGFIYAVARIEASGTNTDGMQTGTASGERTLIAFDGKVITGAGSTVNIASRSRLSAAGAGSVNDATVLGVGIPTKYAILT